MDHHIYKKKKKWPQNYPKAKWTQNFALLFIYQSLCSSFGKKKFKGSHFRIQKWNFKRNLHAWRVPCTIKQVLPCAEKKRRSPLPERHNWTFPTLVWTRTRTPTPKQKDRAILWNSGPLSVTASTKNLLNIPKKSRGKRRRCVSFLILTWHHNHMLVKISSWKKRVRSIAVISYGPMNILGGEILESTSTLLPPAHLEPEGSEMGLMTWESPHTAQEWLCWDSTKQKPIPTYEIPIAAVGNWNPHSQHNRRLELQKVAHTAWLISFFIKTIFPYSPCSRKEQACSCK